MLVCSRDLSKRKKKEKEKKRWKDGKMVRERKMDTAVASLVIAYLFVYLLMID